VFAFPFIILEEGPTACQRGEGGAEPEASSCLGGGGNVFDLAEHISEHPPRLVTPVASAGCERRGSPAELSGLGFGSVVISGPRCRRLRCSAM